MHQARLLLSRVERFLQLLRQFKQTLRHRLLLDLAQQECDPLLDGHVCVRTCAGFGFAHSSVLLTGMPNLKYGPGFPV
ncbi:no similarity (plasmid) [Sinorhizobium fredii HH103]|uniref:No similarity n=1 Tax=Sinorhizobium fredii (strain HH103) TaxID=1117943 RepID=A0A0B7MLE8_SINF1|nr:no similarity [Sinorhizobium fredii HH103]